MEAQFSDVCQEIQEIVGSYLWGLSMSRLFWIERSYQEKFKRSLEYEPIGLMNIEDLLDKMQSLGMVLVCEGSESNQKYVMSAPVVEKRLKHLKLDVQGILDEYHGKIPLTSFESKYMHKFGVELDYELYGLKDIDHLCKVLNLVVEAANSGEKMIKAPKYNLRKRKK